MLADTRFVLAVGCSRTLECIRQIIHGRGRRPGLADAPGQARGDLLQ